MQVAEARGLARGHLGRVGDRAQPDRRERAERRDERELVRLDRRGQSVKYETATSHASPGERDGQPRAARREAAAARAREARVLADAQLAHLERQVAVVLDAQHARRRRATAVAARPPAVAAERRERRVREPQRRADRHERGERRAAAAAPPLPPPPPAAARAAGARGRRARGRRAGAAAGRPRARARRARRAVAAGGAQCVALLEARRGRAPPLPRAAARAAVVEDEQLAAGRVGAQPQLADAARRVHAMRRAA